MSDQEQEIPPAVTTLKATSGGMHEAGTSCRCSSDVPLQ
jgi:hypothetical protein